MTRLTRTLPDMSAIAGDLKPSDAAGGQLSGPLGRRIRDLRPKLIAIAQRHGFSNIRLFGSVARGEERADSDIDLLVDPPTDGVGLLGLARFQRDVEQLLGAPVEIVLDVELRPRVAKRVRRELVALWPGEMRVACVMSSRPSRPSGVSSSEATSETASSLTQCGCG